MTCPHCTCIPVTAPAGPQDCCLCYGTRRLVQCYDIVWAWDYRGCDCRACELARTQRPFHMPAGHLPWRPGVQREPAVPPPEVICSDCQRPFVTWPNDYRSVKDPARCGPCTVARRRKVQVGYQKQRAERAMRRVS